MKNNFYLTTTLPYVNAPLHMGHALEFVRADAIVRYKKLTGYDVFFNTGTDEHGIKIYNKAKEEGLDPKDFVDRGFKVFKEQLKMFGVSEDIHFIRTTDEHHIKAAQEFWKRVDKNGYIYKKNYEAKYCVGCESEKTDSELDEKGECPLHPMRALDTIKEENYFFKYSVFGEKLLDFYEKNPHFVVPDFRFNEIKNFVKNGLQDFSISRLKSKMPWGVAVPGDDTQVMYVWFDALTNYISTLGWPEEVESFTFPLNSDLTPTLPKGEGEETLPQPSPYKGERESFFQKYWINGTPTQYCGKDNTRFQAAMWQAMLFAAGLPNSYQIVVDGFITGEGGVRMSKTIGNVVDPRDIVAEYGTDALRYFLLREVSSFEDSPFTLERFKDAYNSGLANGLGNLVSRVMTMAENNISEPYIPISKLVSKTYDEALENFDIKKAMDVIWEFVTFADRTIQEEQPFKLVKVEKGEGVKIIQDLIEILNHISDLLLPFLPETAQKIKDCILQNKKPEVPLFLRKD